MYLICLLFSPNKPVYKVVVDLCDFFWEPLVLSPEETEQLAQEGTGDQLLIGSVAVKQLLLHPLPDPLSVLEVLVDNSFNLLAIKTLYRDHCGEMCDKN